MTKNRLEAFSDGVLAIIITIMVLEMKAPHGSTLADLKPIFPIFLSYLLSFIYVAIYWNNHHHLLHLVKQVNGQIMWANIHLLFWLSLIPFATAWVGESYGQAETPMALYGVVLLLCAASYTILQGCIVRSQKEDRKFKEALGFDWKGKLSLLAYILAIAFAFWNENISRLIYLGVGLCWAVPDRRMTKILS